MHTLIILAKFIQIEKQQLQENAKQDTETNRMEKNTATVDFRFSRNYKLKLDARRC